MAPSWLDEITPATSPPFLRMGTRALGRDPWLLDGDDVPSQLVEKQRILATHHDEVVARGADAASAELLAEITTRRTTASEASEASEAAGASEGVHPIEVAARLVAEDLCILERSDGHWLLTAGVVCFPSYWRLREKLNRPLGAIHDPVPDYATDLAERVDRFVDRLRPGHGVWRRNWTIHASPDLFAPDPPTGPPDPPIEASEAGERLWLRSERQTLTRLPQTGAVVFTIRTQQVPLATLRERPQLAADIATAVEAWPESQVAYRGGRALTEPLAAYLRTTRDG